MAKVMIVDWRAGWKRREQLTKELTSRGHSVTPANHVAATGIAGRILASWDVLAPGIAEAVRGQDVIILHVGNEQYGWHKALTGPYKKKLVVCFTGLLETPPECTEDCQDNPLHCCYQAPVGDQMDDLALTAIARFVDQAGSGFRDDGALAQAKSDLMSFDPVLEAKLEVLYRGLEGTTINQLRSEAAWRILEADACSRNALNTTDDESSLNELRNRLLPDEPEWAR
jgi:hypothetical protein